MTASLATDAHGAMLQGVLEDHEPRFASLCARELRALARQAHARFLRNQQTLTAAGEERIRIPLAQELAAAGLTQAAIQRVVDKYRKLAGKAAIDRMGASLGVSFEVRNQLLDGVIASQAGAKISTAPEELVRDMMTSLQESYDEGASIPKAAKAMREVGYARSKFYAERIARTELIGTSNAASLAAVHATGAAKFKVWQATNDQRTRPTHRAADGQTVSVRSSFSVGGSSLQYPGDPNGASDEVILCRCSLGYSDTSNLDLIAGASMAAVEQEQEQAVGAKWSGPIAQEDAGTDDGRFFAAGAFEWREPPLTLNAKHGAMHGPGDGDEARVAGRIDSLERVGNDIMGAGVFDTSEWGIETARLVDEGFLKGISVDFSPLEFDLIPDPENPDDPFMASLTFTRAKILGATIVPFPAFENAMIAITAGAAMHARDFRIVDGETVGSFYMPFLTAAVGDDEMAPEDESDDAAEAVADITAAVNGWPGLDGQVVITISGEDTTVSFPPASEGEEPGEASVTAALATIREALRVRVDPTRMTISDEAYRQAGLGGQG